VWRSRSSTPCAEAPRAVTVESIPGGTPRACRTSLGRRGDGGVLRLTAHREALAGGLPRSGGVPVYVGVRAVLEARPVPSGIGAALQPRGVTRGRRTRAQEACPDTASKPVLCARFTFPGARTSGEQCDGHRIVPAARGRQGGCVCGS
jgi:hypothetical protein